MLRRLNFIVKILLRAIRNDHTVIHFSLCTCV
jgi:hypothetical protein